MSGETTIVLKEVNLCEASTVIQRVASREINHSSDHEKNELIADSFFEPVISSLYCQFHAEFQ